MKQSFEELNEEYEIPTEDSDSNSKLIPSDITHDQKNVLMINKGAVKEEDFIDFGIQTVPFQKDECIEKNDYKVLIMSYQPERRRDHQRLISVKEDIKMLNKPKRLACPYKLQSLNSTKISSSKILELLFPK